MKKAYFAGDLDRQITLIDPVVSQNEYGGVETTGKGCTTVWACKEDTINRQIKESMVAEQIVAEGQTVFVIRYNKCVDETWFVVEKRTGLKYVVEGKTEMGRNHWTVLHCVRKDNL